MKNIDFNKPTKLVSTFLGKTHANTNKALFIRSCENQGNLSGTICGWTDMKLTDHGRRQAFLLNSVYESNKHLIHRVYSSDLQRCIDTAFYTMGFPSKENAFVQSKLLREMNFGETEGLHYDGLTSDQKDDINSPDYHAPNGESYLQVKERVQSLFRDIS